MNRAARAGAVAALSLLLLTTATGAPAAAAVGGLAYFALGDSYVSGNGSGNEDGSSCRRSAKAYPPQFAHASGRYALTGFAACSGATIGSVEQSQMSGLGPARLVSVTVGGNDARFGEIIIHCLTPGSGCRSDYPDEDQRIDALAGPLHKLYGEIVAAAPSGELLVVTYPQILRQDGTCESTWTLSREDVDWFRSEYAHMNAVVRRAAEGVPRARVVDVEDALSGHELCTPEEWAFGGRWRDPYSSFHPNALGHTAVAAALRAEAG
jgi:hypothetical protein